MLGHLDVERTQNIGMQELYQYELTRRPGPAATYLIMCIPSRKYASVCVDKRGSRVNATRSGQGGGVLEIHELSGEPRDGKQRDHRRREREREREKESG